MRLFSEKVVPTFTSSDQNIIGVKSYKEIFVDVFEFEINGKKFIAEKVSDYKGSPVVDIPLVLEGKEFTASFVLQRGKEEILFNKNNCTFIRPILEDVQELLSQRVGEVKADVSHFIEKSIADLSTIITKDIDKKHNEVVNLVNEKIINLTTNTIPNVFLKNKSTDNSVVIGSVSEQVNNINDHINTIDATIVKSIRDSEEKIQLSLKEDLEKTNLNLNDTVLKSNNKTLSRLGTTRVQLEKSITKTVTELQSRIELAEDRIRNYYDDRLTHIENNVSTISDKDKEYFINLIEESKQTLLKDIADIKLSIPVTAAKKSQETNSDNKLQSIRTDLEKNISNKFAQEIASIRRTIELSSGGGSVAQQFANGGTMNGDLNVIGVIKTPTLTNPTFGYSSGSGALSSITYSSSATKTFTYTSNKLTRIDLVIGIKTYRKTFNYTGDNLTSIVETEF